MYKTRFSWAGDGGIEGLYPAKRPSVARLVDVLSQRAKQGFGWGITISKQLNFSDLLLLISSYVIGKSLIYQAIYRA